METKEKCKVCSKKGTKKCSNCDAKYCSRECQIKDWPQHKRKCVIFKLYDQIAALMRTEMLYNEVLREHATRITGEFPANSRRLVQFNFPDIDSLKTMINIEGMKKGTIAPVEIMLAKPNEMIDEDPGSQWSIAMDYTRGYDIDREASVAFRVPLEDGYFVQPFVIEFLK